MKLVVTEKNIAARKPAEILGSGKAKSEKVGKAPVYTFQRDGEEWKSIGLKGHVPGVSFPQQVVYDGGSWEAVWAEDALAVPSAMPGSLPTPP